jgi:hypothetical protein
MELLIYGGLLLMDLVEPSCLYADISLQHFHPVLKNRRLGILATRSAQDADALGKEDILDIYSYRYYLRRLSYEK